MRVFVDANVPMYVAGAEHPNRAPSLRFLARVQAGEVEACTSTEVLQEILHRYVRLERRDLARAVYDAFVELCPVVLPVTLADTDRAKVLIAGGGVSARDAIHAAVMFGNDVHRIATFDTDFDRIPRIVRVDLP